MVHTQHDERERRSKYINVVIQTFVTMRHIYISAATFVDNNVRDAFPEAGILRVAIEVVQLLVFYAITVGRR